MGRPPDDAAQVVLRALVAGPVLGLCAALLVAESVHQAPGALLAVGPAAGLAGALVLPGAELTLRATRRRWPGATLPLALAPAALVALLLSPALLVGGEFAALLLATGSSAGATVRLADHHTATPRALLDPDAGLSCLLVLGARLAGQLRGWSRLRQAAAGVWLVLAGAALRVALGRPAAVPLGLVVGVEASLAAVLPWALAAAGQAVRDARARLLAGEASGPLDFTPLGRLLGLIAVVTSWALARRVTGEAGELLRGLADGSVAATLGVAALLVAVDLRAGRLASCGVAAGLAAATLVAGADLAGVLLGATLAAPLPAVRAAAPLLRRLVEACPERHALALLLGLAAAGGCAELDEDRSGAALRLEAAAGLGVAPLAVYEGHLQALARLEADRDAKGWTTLLHGLGLGAPEVRAPAPLLRTATALGDVGAALQLAGDPAEARGPIVAALARGVAAGELAAASALLGESTAPEADRRRALDLLLGAAPTRSGWSVQQGLTLAWERNPAWRAEIEGLLVRDPERWRFALWPLLRRGAPGRPGRALVLVAAARYRPPATPVRPNDRLAELLDVDPGATQVAHLDLIEGFTPAPPAGWAAPLAALDLRPLDADDAAPNGLEAVARGAWGEAWERSRAVLNADPGDPPARRARAHALLAVARGELFAPRPPGAQRAALQLARAHLGLPPASGRPFDLELPLARREAAAVFDEALLRLHERLADPATPAPLDLTELHVALDLVLALADRDVEPRVATLRSALARLGGAPDAARSARLRQRLGRRLLAEAAERTGEAERLRRAAGVLGVTP